VSHGRPAPVQATPPPTGRAPAPPDVAAATPEAPTDDGSHDEPAEAVPTGIGGLFFLINVGQALELYSDFSRPLTPGIALPLWDFLALLALGLLGDGVRDDPAWSLLARLARRGDGEEPGRGFDPPDRWEVPPSWLAPFPEPGAWAWSAAHGRLRVEHPAGFPVVDRPRAADDPEAEAVAVVRRYREDLEFSIVDATPTEVPREPSPLARWAGALSAYVGRRLARAVGQDDAGKAAALVCRLGATALVTPTRLDVVLSLAELPVEVRRAGLDRDPGWVPAAGRYVAFHFD
jgi:hypothetical protein